MTDQLFATGTPLPPLLPPERLGRFVLHRAGIVNVWEYDCAELSFAGGRALLRGSNGAGKSKALEVLLPFLLDGDTRTIDATGRDRTSIYWLMTDRRDPGIHVGYVWLELRMTESSANGEPCDRFLTIGAGLKAATSTRQSQTWFFITEGQRVGEELHLGAEVSLERLREQVGAEAVTQSGSEHRRRVAARLFGVEDATRYRGLVHLLHRLRDPNIGNRVEAGELASLLSDALPPLSDTALDKAAERFEALDQIKDQLEHVEKTAQALDRFLTDYAGYAKTRLAERARAVVEAGTGLRRAGREKEHLATEVDRLMRELASAEQDAARLRATIDRVGAELEALQASEAYQQHRQLDDRRHAVAAKATAADLATGAWQSQADLAAVLSREVARLAGRVEESRQLLRDARALLERHAMAAGLDPAVVPEDCEGIAAGLAAADGRRRAAEHVRSLARIAAETAAGAARADEQAARSEAELSQRQSEADAAGEAWRQATASWREAVHAWTAWPVPEPLRPGAISDLDLSRLRRALDNLAGGANEGELATVASLARRAGSPLRDEALALVVRADTAALAAKTALEEVETEHGVLEAEQEVRPPRSRFQGAERDPNAGAGFYELVEVSPGLEPEAAAGLEAALEASGLLDAFVSSTGLVVHPQTHDTIWRSDAAKVPDGSGSLADVLVPANDQVAALLRTIGLGEPAGTDGEPRPYVTLDGRWSLPPLRGSWAKATSEFLGASTRRETRARRLLKLSRRIAELGESLEAASKAAAEARAAADEVGRWLDELPDDSEVRSGAARARAAGEGLERAEVHHDEDRRLAERERAAAAVARAAFEHAAAAESLPRSEDELALVIEAAGELARELRRWQLDWSALESLCGELDSAREREAERVAAAGEAKVRATVLEADLEREQVTLRTLEEAVGTSVEQVLAQIEDAARRKREAADAEPLARSRTTELAGEMGQATARFEESTRLVAQATELVEATGGRLARALELPGIAAAALGGAGTGGGPLPAGADGGSLPAGAGAGPPPAGAERSFEDVTGRAADLLDRLGEFAAVSDSTILNRLHLLNEGLSGGYDVVDSEEDGVKFVLVADDTGRQPLPAVSARVSAEAAAARERLAARERETIERFLLGELGEEVRERLLEAHDLVRSANAALAAVHSSHGKGARLEWSVDDEATPGARSAVSLLVKSPRSPAEDLELRELLLSLILGQREHDPTAGYSEHLRIALDYRRWHSFKVLVTDEARWPGPRTLSPKLGLSQGEQRVLSYLALFAAAAAHFNSLGAGCPRLLLLDDAFAKVDEPTHGRLLELLVDLDLDFLLTSERMWGCFEQVPSLEIYEVLRDPSAPGVALVHFHWDGHERRLVGI